MKPLTRTQLVLLGIGVAVLVFFLVACKAQGPIVSETSATSTPSMPIANKPVSYVTRTLPKIGIEVRVPENWKEEEYAQAASYVYLFTSPDYQVPETSPLGDLVAGDQISISLSYDSYTPRESEAFLAWEAEQFSPNYYTPIEGLSIPGADAFVAMRSYDPGIGFSPTVVMLRQGQVFHVSFERSNPASPSHDDIAMHVLESLKFLK